MLKQSIPVVISGEDNSASYIPELSKINAGDTITWYNDDDRSHTVTSRVDSESDVDKIFDSNTILPNQHYSITLAKPGKYEYHCLIHPDMSGSILVK